jgi:tetratricopeptide (TPR) repeat protein
MVFVALSLFLFIQAEVVFAQTPIDLLTRAKASIENKNNESAVKDLTDFTKSEASNSEAFATRAHAYINLKKYEAAIADSSRAIEISPNFGWAYYLRGLAYLWQTKTDARSAKADFTKLIALDPKLAVEGYRFRAGINNEFDKDYAAAISDANEAIRLNPTYGNAFAERGWANLQLNKYEPAASDYRQAVKLKFATSNVYTTLSFVEFKLKNYAQAGAAARKALELDPNNQNAKDNLAGALAEQKKKYNAAATEALWSAAKNNDTQAAIEALNQGADPNATFNYYDVLKTTSLMVASLKRNLELASALINAGANVNALEEMGGSALTYSFKGEASSKEMINLLLKNGADINLGEEGSSPLKLAAIKDDEEIIEIPQGWCECQYQRHFRRNSLV